MIDRKCAVIIGVNKTGQLPELTGAIKGAVDFDEWARSKGFDTKLITDENESVTVRRIKDAIKFFTKDNIYDLMIVYYAGHGFLKSAYDEFWLLSEAPEDPNEAVNLISSKSFARKARIPHVVIISDACRSRPLDPQIIEVVGSAIFANPGGRNDIDDTINIDMLFATRPGEPAYEALLDDAVPGYKGIYTEFLIKGLNGKVPGITESYMNGKTPLRVIYSNSLQNYLAEEVPKAIEKINIRATQKPYADITSRAPKFLVEFPQTSSPQESIKQRRQSGSRIPSGRRGNRMSFTVEPVQKKYPVQTEPTASSEMIREMREILTASPGDFTGFVIKGVEYVKVLYGNDHQVETQKGSFIIRLSPEITFRTLVLELPGKRSVPLAVLPGFIGTVTIQEGVVIDINYQPSTANNRHSQFRTKSSEIDERRAVIALSTRSGFFKISDDTEQVISSASYLRHSKALDPMLGLYATYAYAQGGAAKQIRSVHQYMLMEKEPVLFDVVMLDNLFNEDNAPLTEPTAPLCPMLNQGWSYLTGDKEAVSPELWEISRYREPGLWTTFSDKGTELFISYLRSRA